jgi:hypothetical protein
MTAWEDGRDPVPVRAQLFGRHQEPDEPDEPEEADGPGEVAPVRQETRAAAHRAQLVPRRRSSVPLYAVALLVVAAVVVWAAVGHGAPPRTGSSAPNAAATTAADDSLPGSGPSSADPTGTPDPASPSPGRTPAASASPSSAGSSARPSGSPRPATSAPSPVRADLTGRITGASGMCLDLAGGQTADGSLLLTVSCRSSGTQVWTLAVDKTLRSHGKCVTVNGDGVSTGASLGLWPCAGDPTQGWRSGSNGSLVNPATGKCLDDNHDGIGGNYVRIAPCDASAAQRWKLPA